ncbi:MAG: ABC transporter permease [Halobacteriaceae archaeon]
MAVDTDRDTAAFTDIDWTAHDTSTLPISKTTIVELAVYGVIVAAFLYDWLVILEGPTIGAWDVSSVEWMFVPTLVFLGFHGVVPLYRNQRLARYYWQQFQKNKMAVVSLAFLAVVFATGIVGPMVLDPPGSVDISTRLQNQLEPPVGITTVVQAEVKTGTWAYPLGTDAKGRGILKLIIFGMRVSMEVGLIATVMAMSIGSVVGTVAAYSTAADYDMVDEVLMRYVDIQSVFPVFILLLLTIYLFGPQLWFIIALYGFFGWEGIARAVRGEALQRAEEEYITASRAAGANTGWIVRRHLIPNVTNTIITLATLAIPGYILGEAALSFLGFGDPDTYSWGRTISAGRSALGEAPWISTIPGFFLFFTVLGINFVGDAALDALDPRR